MKAKTFKINYINVFINYNGELSIADSEISNNTAKRNGGAIANGKDELNIIRPIFLTNPMKSWKLRNL